MAKIGENSVVGTGFKLNINMTPIDGFHMSDVDWECLVFTEAGFNSMVLMEGNNSMVIKKSDAVKVDNDNYLICIDTAICGAGRYYITLTAYIPDRDFADGYRPERKTAYSGVIIDMR